MKLSSKLVVICAMVVFGGASLRAMDIQNKTLTVVNQSNDNAFIIINNADISALEHNPGIELHFPAIFIPGRGTVTIPSILLNEAPFNTLHVVVYNRALMDKGTTFTISPYDENTVIHIGPQTIELTH